MPSPPDPDSGGSQLADAVLRGSSRRGFLEWAGGALIALAGGASAARLLLPDDAEAYTNFCGHTYTTGNCPHPTGLPRVDRNDYPLRAGDGHPVDDLGRPIDAHGYPVDAKGHRLSEPDGEPLAPAPRSKVCPSAGEEHGLKLQIDGSWYRCCGRRVRRLMDCCGYSSTRINGDEALVGYCYAGRKVFCVQYYETNMPVLSGLAVAAMLTALLAGVAGAWSPCGFSMLDTIGSALGDARRPAILVACVTFTLGAVLGGAATFGGLGWIGGLVGEGAGGLREALGAGLATAAAVADWRGVRIAPQIRRQVPERWRWTMPLPLACGLYGILLGLGFTTFVLAFAVWALAGISFTAGSPAIGLLIGLSFGIGRSLPILWMAPGLQRGAGAARLAEMACEPRLWLGLRRLGAFGLVLCAMFLTSIATAAAAASRVATGSDPSAAGEAMAWQPSGGPGMLRIGSAPAAPVAGVRPTLGPSMIAWLADGAIVLTERSTLAVTATIPVGPANALALSDTWVAYRAIAGDGSESLIAIPLAAPTRPSLVLRARPAGQIGRPALDGSNLVFAFNTPGRSVIEQMNLVTGARRILRAAHSRLEFANPALLGRTLLYERVDRCAQDLRLGPAASEAQDRVLVRLPSTVQRDPGYQPGYEHNWNGASGCRGRGPGPGGPLRLGATALEPTSVLFTEIIEGAPDGQILSISR